MADIDCNNNLPNLKNAHDTFTQALSQLIDIGQALKKKADFVDSLDQGINDRFHLQMSKWRTDIETMFSELRATQDEQIKNFVTHMETDINIGIKDLAKKQEETLRVFQTESVSIWKGRINRDIETMRDMVKESFAEINIDLENRNHRIDEIIALAVKHQEDTVLELISEGRNRLEKRLEPILSKIETATHQKVEELIESFKPILNQLKTHESQSKNSLLNYEKNFLQNNENVKSLLMGVEKNARNQLGMQKKEFQDLNDSILKEQQKFLYKLHQDIEDKTIILENNYESTKEKLENISKDQYNDLNSNLSEGLSKGLFEIHKKIHTQISNTADQRWAELKVNSTKMENVIKQLEKEFKSLCTNQIKSDEIYKKGLSDQQASIEILEKAFQEKISQNVQAIELESKRLKKRIRWASVPGTLAFLLLITFIFFFIYIKSR